MKPLLLSIVLSILNLIQSNTVSLVTTWLESNRELTKLTQHLIEKEESAILQLKRAVIDYEEIESKSRKDPDIFIVNALTSYILTKRLTIDFESLKPTLNSSWIEGLPMPSMTELMHQADQLTGLALAYQDQVQLVQFSPPFCLEVHGNDFFILGKLAYMKNDPPAVVLWMNVAWQVTTQHEFDNEMLEILEYLSIGYFAQGDTELAVHTLTNLLYWHPTHYRSLINQQHFKRSKEKHNSKIGAAATANYDTKMLNEFCIDTSSLIQGHCYFDRETGFLKLAPFKKEVLNDLLNMELIHDFLTHGEAEIIKQIAEPTFTTQVNHDQKPLTQAALVYPDNEIVKKVYQRVEDATMLDMKQSDPLQVTAYQPGGLYLPHFDFNAGSLNPGLYNEQTGHRIATFLLYVKRLHISKVGKRIHFIF